MTANLARRLRELADDSQSTITTELLWEAADAIETRQPESPPESDWADDGTELTVTLSPKEANALYALSNALWTLGTFYRPSNRGDRSRDGIDTAIGRRSEFEDSLAAIEQLSRRAQAL